MRKTIVTLSLALVLVLTLVGAASAQADLPVGGCPGGFTLMEVMDHEHDHEGRHHLGLHNDINGDGYLCVLEVSSTYHVHVDNYAVLP